MARLRGGLSDTVRGFGALRDGIAICNVNKVQSIKECAYETEQQ
jgi:hypothetical protein